jgi:multidrug efflux pump subunit AcrA (membrane-fusion protein)
MSIRIPYLPAALALAATIVSGCAHGGAPQGAPPPISVTTAKIGRGAISTFASFDAEITPIYQTTLSTAQAGTVTAVDVTEGDFVHRGQLLASLDTSQLQATLEANEAQVRADEAQLVHGSVAAPIAAQQYSSAVATARQNLQSAVNSVRSARAALAHDELTERADLQLLGQQYVSRETYEQARATAVASRETLRSDLQAVTAQQAALRTALSNTKQRLEDQATIAQDAAGLDEARANVKLLEAQIAQSSIVAPFDGQVTQRLLDPGAYAGASSGVFTIAQVSRVYVVADVPDVDLPAVSLGKAVTFTTPSLTGRTFHGHIFDINTTPTSGTLSYRVRILQTNPDLALRGGMFANVSVERARHSGVLLVPSAAITNGPGGPSIFVVAGGKAKNVPVRVGLQSDSVAEVAGDGLTAGTTVVASQPGGLQDGAAIADADPGAAAHVASSVLGAR